MISIFIQLEKLTLLSSQKWTEKSFVIQRLFVNPVGITISQVWMSKELFCYLTKKFIYTALSS